MDGFLEQRQLIVYLSCHFDNIFPKVIKVRSYNEYKVIVLQIILRHTLLEPNGYAWSAINYFGRN